VRAGDSVVDELTSARVMCPRCCEDRDYDQPDGCRDPDCPTVSDMENEAERRYMRQLERDK
ncbi:MAG TPA: hypothetical protein VF447_17530, partial [Terriglobales bacterium]